MTKDTFDITAQELTEIAIIPLLKRVVNMIVASIINRDIFGHYDIAKLFVTGHFLRIKKYSQAHHYLIETEFRKALEDSLLHKSYKTAFDIAISTCQEQPPKFMLNQKHYCYDKLIRGELGTVSNSTYFLRRYSHLWKSNECLINVEINGSRKYGHSSELLFRGERFVNKRLKLDVIYDERAVDRGKAFLLGSYYALLNFASLTTFL